MKKYRRRIFIVKIVRKSDEEPVNEEDCKVEEVEFDEDENDEYDPDVSCFKKISSIFKLHIGITKCSDINIQKVLRN